MNKNRAVGVKLGQVSTIRKLNRELAKISKMDNSQYESCFMDSCLTGIPLSVVENSKGIVKDAGNFLSVYSDLAVALQENLVALKTEYESLDLDNTKFEAVAENVAALKQEFDCIVDNVVCGTAPLAPADVDASGTDTYQLLKGVQNLICGVSLNLYNFRDTVAPSTGLFSGFVDASGASTFNVAWADDGASDLFILEQDASDNILVGATSESQGTLDEAIAEIDDLIVAAGGIKKSLGVYNDIVDNNCDRIDNLMEKRECAIAEDKANRIDDLTEQIEFCEIVTTAL
jgi:hypothetical protein